MKARLFGAVHVDRPGKVRRELAALAEGTEAFCVERPTAAVPVSTWLRFLCRAPLAAVGFGLNTLVQLPLYLVLTRDLVPPEQAAAIDLADERDVPVEGVDRPIQSFSEYGGTLWILTNYLVLAGLLALAPLATTVTALALLLPRAVFQPVYARHRLTGTLAAAVTVLGAPALVYATGHASPLLALAAVLFLLVAVRRTLTTRDRVMAEGALDIAETVDASDVTIVAGRAHLPGIHAILAERGVDVTTVHRSRAFRENDSETNPTPPSSTAGSTARHADLDPDARDVLGRRVAAAVVDLAFAAVFGLLGASLSVAVPVVGGSGWAKFVGGVLAWTASFVFFEALVGQTLGKRLFGLAVCDSAGDPPGIGAIALRNALRLVDVLGFYLVGVCVLLVFDYRRLGDLAAGTRVVDARETRDDDGTPAGD